MKINKLLIIVLAFFSFFTINSKVIAQVNYTDIQFNLTTPYYNVFYYLTNGLDNNIDKDHNRKFAYLISEKSNNLIEYFSSLLIERDNSFKISDFKALGFGDKWTLETAFTDNVSKDFKEKISLKFEEYDSQFFVILYRDVYIRQTESFLNYEVRGTEHGQPVTLFFNRDLELVGYYDFRYSFVNGFTMFEVDYSYLRNNIGGEYLQTKNVDITLLLNLVYTRFPGYKIKTTGFNNIDRTIVESVYFEDKRYELADSSLYGVGGKIWNFVNFWKIGDALISSVSSSSLIKYRKSPILSKDGGYITPYESLYDVDLDSVPETPPSTYKSVDLSLDSKGYYFIPISSTDYSPNEVDFYFFRSQKGSSLVTSTFDYTSGSFVRNSIYLSYAFTKSTLGAYKYFKITGTDYKRDINLSTSKETKDFVYKNNIILMYTDFFNSSTFVYYDSSKYKVIDASSVGSSLSIYGTSYSINTNNLYNDVDKAVHEFVGYDGDIYELGSVQWNGVLDGGYDNWKDCVDNDCITSNEDWADTGSQWQFGSLDDIINSAWSGISGLMGSVSAVVAMFNTLFSGLPPIISSTFQIIFVTSMVLILLKILL